MPCWPARFVFGGFLVLIAGVMQLVVYSCMPEMLHGKRLTTSDAYCCSHTFLLALFSRVWNIVETCSGTATARFYSEASLNNNCKHMKQKHKRTFGFYERPVNRTGQWPFEGGPHSTSVVAFPYRGLLNASRHVYYIGSRERIRLLVFFNGSAV